MAITNIPKEEMERVKKETLAFIKQEVRDDYYGRYIELLISILKPQKEE